jgi:hypothetical protein
VIAGLKWLSGHLKYPPVSFTALKRSLSEESGSWGTLDSVVVVVCEFEPFVGRNKLIFFLYELKVDRHWHASIIAPHSSSHPQVASPICHPLIHCFPQKKTGLYGYLLVVKVFELF